LKTNKTSRGFYQGQVKAAISIAVGIYSLVFIAAYHYLTNGIVSAMALVPAMMIGWIYGKRAGFLGGFILSGWNVLLFMLVGASALELTFVGPGLLGSLFLVCMGGAAGWMSELLKRMQQQAEELSLEITEKRRIEQELRASEVYNRAVMSAFPDLMFVLDQQGTFLDYQASDPSDLYMPPSAIKGSNIKDVMPGKFAETCLQHIALALQTGTIQAFEYQLPMSQGMQDYEARLVKINESSVLAVVRNLTPVKQAQRQQIIVTIQREQIEALNELIANLSHDFRTPLSVINTSLYLLRRQLDIKEADKYLQKIQSQSTRLERYIGAILTLSRLDSDPNLHLVQVNLSQLLHPLEVKFRAHAKHHSIYLTSESDVNLPSVLGDYRLLSQALAQLIDNAINYNRKGGKVTVRGYTGQQRLVIEVQDTGIGIDAAYYQRIFERFYRVDPARSSETGGLGLGLAIAQKITELHKGRIEVESQPNRGSTFRIYLPVGENVETDGYPIK
jgi:signal transduction histidine kinase